jgi:hypothetical protein
MRKQVRQLRAVGTEVLRELVQVQINLDSEGHRDGHLGNGSPRSNDVEIARFAEAFNVSVL